MSASLLDRLGAADGGAPNLREGLRRDIERLLNARRRLFSPPRELDALEGSLLDYGLDDFAQESQASEDFRLEFIEKVEALLARFEPRLGRVSVSVVSSPEGLDRTLRFRITGVAVLGGARQELHFDSFVDPADTTVVVRG